MKAAVLYETNRELEIRELEQEPPKAGEVRVRVGAAGVCASDRHVMKGTSLLPLPVVLGHEAAGTVEEVGEGVVRVKPGDRCILSFVSNCGHCRTCRVGLPNICETNLETGPSQYDGTTRLHDGDTGVYQMGKLGAFAESMVIPQQACQPVPDEVPFPVGALIGCRVTTGVGAVINSPAAAAGMSVAVFGCGGVGLNVIQGARLMGASRIIAVDIYDHKLEFSYKFGATDVVNAREVDAVEAIRDLTDGGVDLAFDSFGSPQVMSDAVKAVRKGGAGVMIGLGPLGEGAPIDMVDFIRNQKSLLGAYYGMASPHETFGKLVDLYLKGRIDVDGLITREYPLEEINEGFDALAAGEDGRGVIVYPS
jgi:Zn-dependent alcohol dehydrogenase